ncbi:MAG: PKD domain-containing protein [Verrucomicrobia bacterium]|nr:PKD domain-containing protein [Verrucomicrobiota bacterium]
MRRSSWRWCVPGFCLGAGLVLVLPRDGAAQTLTVLHTFAPLVGYQNGDGYNPNGLLLSGSTLYGTSEWGGHGFGGYGTVFRVNTDGGAFTNLHSFWGDADGCFPGGVIIAGTRLYGMTGYAGGFGLGTLFTLDPSTASYGGVVHAFDTNGGYPYDRLLVASGSILYGTTELGYETSGRGTVFKINTDGTGFANFHTFTGSDGDNPGTLVLSGNTLYGATFRGGSTGSGTIFRINTDGTEFASLYSFTATHTNAFGVSTNSDGANPGFLVLSGTSLYGGAGGGGGGGSGTIFKINADGTGFTVLHTFSAASTSASGFPTNGDGTGPVVWISSGTTLYGAAGGGLAGSGTIFSLNTDGTGFTNLYLFTAGYTNAMGRYTNSDGTVPGALVLSGTTLYGAAAYGGAFGSGTLFSLSLGPTVAFGINPTNGLSPLATQFTAPAADSVGKALVSWNWDFGDGSTGTNQNPMHTYAQPGIYSPVLVATNNAGIAVQGIGPWVTVSAPTVPFSASVTNGFNPLAVQFTSTNLDSSGQAVVSWNWNFGDGTTSTNQNPVHTYLQAGLFLPILVATNSVGSEVVGVGPVIAAGAFVANGGFETGDLSSWIVSGSQATIAASPHSGQYAVELTPFSPVSLSQSILTRPGASYLVSCWVHNLAGSSATFTVAWEGTNVFNRSYGGDTGWTNIQLRVTANTGDAVLQLGCSGTSFFASPDLEVDDVSVTDTTGIPSVDLGQGNLGFVAGQFHFQIAGPDGQQVIVQASTNLLNWLSLSTNTIAGGSFGFTDTANNGVNERFYRLLLMP